MIRVDTVSASSWRIMYLYHDDTPMYQLIQYQPPHGVSDTPLRHCGIKDVSWHARLCICNLIHMFDTPMVYQRCIILRSAAVQNPYHEAGRIARDASLWRIMRTKILIHL